MTPARSLSPHSLTPSIRWAIFLSVCFTALCTNIAVAQQSYRPGGAHDDPINTPRDLSGYSVRGPRIRIVHTTDPALPGGSMYLQQVDPWLGYLWGRELTQREFTPAEGVLGEVSKSDGVLLPDGATHMMSRDHVNSCMACHNTPYRDAGAGVTIPKNGGTGRNTPHLFGAGLIEMLGGELRLAALHIADDDRNGWIDLLEAKDKRFVYHTAPSGDSDGGAGLDFGRFDDHDLDGRPDLNQVFYIVYVDGRGRRIPWAGKLTDPGVKGYRLEVQVYGHSQLRVANRPPIAGTLRAFTAAAFDIHQGLQAYDPTVLAEIGQTGISRVSNAGCVQFVTAAGRDRGRVLGKDGISLDDPDRDGVPHELTEGDLDVVEWYLMNHPRPARGRQTKQTRRGEQLFREIGCAECHTPNWYLPPALPDEADYTLRHIGDRRFFDVEVTYNARQQRLEGKLVSLADKLRVGDVERNVPRRGSFLVSDIYTDLRYHDVGPEFYQVQYDGSVVKQFRTPPLWGVGSTAPYGHDGASLDLESVILRHGGEARESRERFVALRENEQQAVQAFLRSLVLYQTDQLPCDINGDGRIDESFIVAGQNVGRETLRPEWLLRMPCRIEGEITNVLGGRINSMAVTNLRAAYGLDLEYLKDNDEDGWPDVINPQPRETGVRSLDR
jgi:hypothetical protein